LSKSEKRSLSIGNQSVLIVLITCQPLVPPNETRHLSPQAAKTSVFLSALKSAKPSSETPWLEVLMTCQPAVPPNETRHLPPQVVNTSAFPSPLKSPNRISETP